MKDGLCFVAYILSLKKLIGEKAHYLSRIKSNTPVYWKNTRPESTLSITDACIGMSKKLPNKAFHMPNIYAGKENEQVFHSQLFLFTSWMTKETASNT